MISLILWLDPSKYRKILQKFPKFVIYIYISNIIEVGVCGSSQGREEGGKFQLSILQIEWGRVRASGMEKAGGSCL